MAGKFHYTTPTETCWQVGEVFFSTPAQTDFRDLPNLTLSTLSLMEFLMIAPSDDSSCEGVPELEEMPPDFIVLARYGRVPQVARFAGFGEPCSRSAEATMATNLKKTDVVVVGLGAAGGAAALPLARGGLEVIGLRHAW